jgi:hypothetical protein
MADSTLALILTAALLGLASSAVAQPATMSEQVVKFCKDNLRNKVGDGECYDLAEAALKQAGAKLQTEFKDSPKAGDYVWGKLAYTIEIVGGSQKVTKDPTINLQPGDVLQFGDARFEGKNLRGFEKYTTMFPHHTAVVLDVNKADGILTALEQNVNGKRIVMENTYRLTDLKSGWVRVYRPVPK